MIAGLLAWLAACTGVLALFSFADKAASPEGKARARELLDFGWRDTVTRWPTVFVEMFDSIFGKKHFTWKCFGRSCVATAIGVIICSLTFYSLQRDVAVRMLGEVQGPAGIFALALILNMVPDYLSLLVTRWLLRSVTRGAFGMREICSFAIVDAAFTLAIFVGGLILLNAPGSPVQAWKDVGVMITHIIPSFLFLGSDQPPVSLKIPLGIFLWTTYFTSIWLWLYALATFAGKLLLPVLNRIQKFKRFFDLDNKPFLALGWLSVMIITVLFALGAVVKACV